MGMGMPMGGFGGYSQPTYFPPPNYQPSPAPVVPRWEFKGNGWYFDYFGNTLMACWNRDTDAYHLWQQNHWGPRQLPPWRR